MLIRRGLVLALIVVCATVGAAIPQGTPLKVQLPTSPTTDIAVRTIQPEDFPADKTSSSFKVNPASFVLTNLSNRAVVAIAVEWSYTAEDGHQGHGFSKSTGLSTKTGPVVEAHARLFVGPKVFLPESLSGAHVGPQFEALDGRAAHWAATASLITAKIDAIIFDDGELVGPDESQLDLEIQSQKIAANQVASAVRHAQSANQDYTPILKKMAETPMHSQTDFMSLWSGYYAQQLLSARGSNPFELRLSAMEQTPLPLRIFRKTSSNQ